MLQTHSGSYPKPTTPSRNQPTSRMSFTARLSCFKPHLKKINYAGVNLNLFSRWEHSELIRCELWDSHSTVAEDSDLLGYSIVPLGKQFPTYSRITLPLYPGSSSQRSSCFLLRLLDPKDECTCITTQNTWISKICTDTNNISILSSSSLCRTSNITQKTPYKTETIMLLYNQTLTPPTW